MEFRMESIYYSPKGYWKGKSAINKLANAAHVTRTTAANWLSKQAIWQIYLPAPKKINYSHFDVRIPNEVHQADILVLPHEGIYKYALTVVDIASRYKEAEPLRNKSSNETSIAFKKIYQRGPLNWPNLLQVDPGKEFKGEVLLLMKKHNVSIRQGHTAIHRDQAIVERFNRTLAERLFGYQYAREFILNKRSREWVKRLPSVINALNNEVTRTINLKPNIAIKKKYINPNHQLTIGHDALLQPLIGRNVTVRYLYEPGELEGGTRRATDPIWSITTHTISSITRSQDSKGFLYRPAIYKLDSTAPQRGFTYEQLQVIPEDTQSPNPN